MTQEITDKVKCVVMRSGVEVWISQEQSEKLRVLLDKNVKFVELEDETINTADIIGIFKAESVEDMRRRKHGEWKCKYGYWHDFKEQCGHGELAKYEKKNNQTTT